MPLVEKRMAHLREWIDLAARLVQTFAVALMLAFILFGTCGWLLHSLNNIEGAYERYRIVLGKTLLIGLELLVAADIMDTVALDLTLKNLELLAGLVLVRTALGWTLTVEVKGHWPWQETTESRLTRTGIAPDRQPSQSAALTNQASPPNESRSGQGTGERNKMHATGT